MPFTRERETSIRDYMSMVIFLDSPTVDGNLDILSIIYLEAWLFALLLCLDMFFWIFKKIQLALPRPTCLLGGCVYANFWKFKYDMVKPE